MLISQDKQSHYCYIKSLNRLRYDQHNTGHKVFFCERYPQGFSSQNVLDDHLFCCRGIKCRPENKIEMPKEGKNIVKFENYQNQMKVPWIIYADFESLVEKIHGCKRDPSGSSTTKTEVHTPCGFGFMAVRSDSETMGPYVYRGKNTVKDFLYYLQIIERDIRNDLHKKANIIMTREDWADYNKASECHICHKTLYKNNFLDAVDVYDPNTGEYIGQVHRKTNDDKCYKSTFNIVICDEDLGNYEIPFVGPRRQRNNALAINMNYTSMKYLCSMENGYTSLVLSAMLIFM